MHNPTNPYFQTRWPNQPILLALSLFLFIFLLVSCTEDEEKPKSVRNTPNLPIPKKLTVSEPESSFFRTGSKGYDTDTSEYQPIDSQTIDSFSNKVRYINPMIFSPIDLVSRDSNKMHGIDCEGFTKLTQWACGVKDTDGFSKFWLHSYINFLPDKPRAIVIADYMNSAIWTSTYTLRTYDAYGRVINCIRLAYCGGDGGYGWLRTGEFTSNSVYSFMDTDDEMISIDSVRIKTKPGKFIFNPNGSFKTTRGPEMQRTISYKAYVAQIKEH